MLLVLGADVVHLELGGAVNIAGVVLDQFSLDLSLSVRGKDGGLVDGSHGKGFLESDYLLIEC